MLVAADLQRPAAIEQLHVVGQQVGAAVYSEKGATDPVKLCQNAIQHARGAEVQVVILDTAGRLAIDQELMDQLRRRVAAGQWVAGQQLPSVRELALELAVHPMTISKAYGLLESEGLLTRRRGLPMVIADSHRQAVAPRDRIGQLRPTLARAAAEARELAIPAADALSLFAQLLQAPDPDTAASAGDPR